MLFEVVTLTGYIFQLQKLVGEYMTLIVQKVRWGELMGSNFLKICISYPMLREPVVGLVSCVTKCVPKKNHNQIVTTKVKNERCLN